MPSYPRLCQRRHHVRNESGCPHLHPSPLLMTHRTGIFFPSSGICLELETGGCRSFAVLWWKPEAGREDGREEESVSCAGEEFVSYGFLTKSRQADTQDGRRYCLLSQCTSLTPPHSSLVHPLTCSSSKTYTGSWGDGSADTLSLIPEIQIKNWEPERWCSTGKSTSVGVQY